MDYKGKFVDRRSVESRIAILEVMLESLLKYLKIPKSSSGHDEKFTEADPTYSSSFPEDNLPYK